MEYKTPSEIAEEMKLNPETVRRMCKRGDMYAIKCGNQWRIPVGNPDQWQIPCVSANEDASIENGKEQSYQPQEAESKAAPTEKPSPKENHSGKRNSPRKRQLTEEEKKREGTIRVRAEAAGNTNAAA